MSNNKPKAAVGGFPSDKDPSYVLQKNKTTDDNIMRKITSK